ncbi:MAG: response regulator transcription factor [Oscillospiraceae bacterium]|jgi:DNA-binding response OmpR family regulator|nr:response regulator transcription factor [Oscillospiraceae bacterium]
MRTLLVVDSDARTQSELRARLAREGYNVLTAPCANEGLELIVSAEPSAVLLEQALPDGSGFDLCRAFRRRTSVPILMMGSRSVESDRVRALDIGADDFVMKPFGFDELAARIRAALRRYDSASASYAGHGSLSGGGLSTGPFTADTGSRTIVLRGKRLALTSKEFDLLLFFMKNPGRVFTKEMLYANIWDADFDGDTRTVMVYISRLRKKIEDCPDKPELLLNVWGVGYKLNCSEEKTA